MTKGYQTIETNKLYYKKYRSKVKFYSDITRALTYSRTTEDKKKLLTQLEKKLAQKNKSGKYKIKINGYSYYWRFSENSITLTTDQLKNAIETVKLILVSDKQTLSYSYNTSHFFIYTSMTEEWTDLLQSVGDSRNIIWTISEEAERLFNQNENICVVNKPPEYEFKVYLTSRKVDPELAKFLTSYKHGFRVGDGTLDNIAGGYWCSGNYFYAKSRKYLTLVQMSYGKSIRRVDRMVYKHAETV